MMKYLQLWFVEMVEIVDKCSLTDLSITKHHKSHCCAIHPSFTKAINKGTDVAVFRHVLRHQLSEAH